MQISVHACPVWSILNLPASSWCGSRCTSPDKHASSLRTQLLAALARCFSNSSKPQKVSPALAQLPCALMWAAACDTPPVDTAPDVRSPPFHMLLRRYISCVFAQTGSAEFTTYLPINMQSVLVQPLGDEGVMVLGSDHQRGFGRVDQVMMHFPPHHGMYLESVARCDMHEIVPVCCAAQCRKKAFAVWDMTHARSKAHANRVCCLCPRQDSESHRQLPAVCNSPPRSLA